MTDYAVRRNYWDKPWVRLPETGEGPIPGEPRANGKKKWWYSPKNGPAAVYDRPSSAGDGLDTKKGLVDWSAAQAAIGAVLNRSVASDLTTLINEFDGDPWRNGDDGSPNSGKSRLVSVVERAREAAGANQASAGGTEFHKLTEIINYGKTPTYIPDHLLGLIEQYKQAVKDLTFLSQEVFVVNDQLRMAGSMDHLIRLPDGRVVVSDLKTGRSNHRYPLSTICQIAVYANSVRYDQETGVRTPLDDEIDKSVGVMIHFPIQTKDPKVTLYLLPLDRGYDAAKLSQQVVAMRKAWDLEVLSL